MNSFTYQGIRFNVSQHEGKTVVRWTQPYANWPDLTVSDCKDARNVIEKIKQTIK